MKKNGFTLVEILSVVVILGVIAIVILPNIGGSTTKKKQEEYNKLVTLIENAAKAYHATNKEITKVDIQTLINNNLLTAGLTDNSGNPIAGCIRITKDSDGFNVYNYYEDCTAATVSLIVNKNGGDTSQTFNETYQENEKLELLEATRDGYYFKGWQVVRGNSIINGKNLIFGNTDTEIYATWQSYPTLIIDPDGGTLTIEKVNSSYPTGYQIDLGIPTITETGTETQHVFLGWEVISGNSVLSGTLLTIGTTDTYVKAKWGILTNGV